MGKFLISLKRLEKWFESNSRVLPWRDQPSVYRVWVSEVMLQQTQVVTVIPYFERFMARFPRVEDLAQAQESEVLQLWAGLGYYSRARNLHRASQQIVEKNQFPKSRIEWLEVPGVGAYTAGAILSIADNLPEPILDGNIERVLSRVRRVSRQDGDAQFKVRLWKISTIFVKKAFLHEIPPRVLNQALMEVGATLCHPKGPQCSKCPLKQLCRAHSHGDAELFPPKKKAKSWIKVQESMHCLVNHRGEVLVRRRQPGEWRAGLWDLLESDPHEMGMKAVRVGQVQTRHVVTRHKIERTTSVWKVQSKRISFNSLKAAECDSQFNPCLNDLKWVSIQNPEVAVGSALKLTLKKVGAFRRGHASFSGHY